MGMTYQRGAVWWVKYYRNGRPMRESSGSTKESDAIQLLKIREGDIAHGLPVNNIVSECDLVEAAKKLNTLQPLPPSEVRLKPDTTSEDRDGHNLGTVGPDRGSRLRVSL